MKCPLRKRYMRELKSEFGKYLVIFILMVLMIGEVSGFLVADTSMLKAYNESFEKYHVEDGNFLLSAKANKVQCEDISALGLDLYENFYRQIPFDNGSTLRVFRNRTRINLACVMDGRLPEKKGEIAIDRMYADNNHIRTGDTMKAGKRSYLVTGLIALSDYSALFENNTDSMFDSIKFGVSTVADEEFDSFDANSLKYSYSYVLKNPVSSEEEEHDVSDDLMSDINDIVPLESFTPRYLNQAIIFTGDDMGSDKVMMEVFLYIIIAIMAFVFGITISDTIRREAGVIGTLRATGLSRSELIRHYMAMPLMVTLVSALVGNVLGYTFFKYFNAHLYYGSYSLPTYTTVWSSEAFFKTTLVPVFLMVLVTFTVLHRRLKISPLSFLRGELRKSGKKRALRLSAHIPFFTRFRLRVIFQNMGNYVILFIGVMFANLLLMFGMLFPAVLAHYQETMVDNLLCKYQYILQIPASAVNDNRKLESLLNMYLFSSECETRNKSAEKFSCDSLEIVPTHKEKQEEVLVYGVQKHSSYIHHDFHKDDVLISSAYADKYHLGEGDRIRLKEKYGKKSYDFDITGVYPYQGGLSVFMDRRELNRLFDLSEDSYSGYFSNEEITDIPKQYIATVIDEDSLTRISRQLSVSFGEMMYLVDGIAMIIFMVLIYLLSKIIIEKNAQAISMTKILGYSDSEIGMLYILPTTFAVIAMLLITLPLGTLLMVYIFRYVMLTMITGWIPLYLDPVIYVKMFAMGLFTYGAVALLELLKIRRVPMEDALKNSGNL